MTCSVSCGYFVVIRLCSASAVDLAMPQVPRSAIEYDRSTSRQTAARGAPLGLERPRSPRPPGVTRSPRRRAASPARRSTALRTVRTTSSGCSSPNRHSRLEPVRSPAEPASRTSWSPRPRASRCWKTLVSADAPSRRTACGVSSSCAVAPVQVALPLELALELLQRLAGRRPPDRPSARATASASTSSSEAPG